MKIPIAVSLQMKNGLDDDYTLYDDGSVLHEYDRNMYPSGLNKKEMLSISDLSLDVKKRLLNSAAPQDEPQVRKLLGLT